MKNPKKEEIFISKQAGLKEFVYVCEKCGKTYTTKNSLQENLDGKYICPVDNNALVKFKRIDHS
ncbi:MAG: hypothetical protein P8Y97_08140 [Candidatus Lokiarchaeota archaeon]